MLADVAALNTYLGNPVDDTAQAEAALRAASGIVRAETGQTITLVENDTVTLYPEGDTVVELPERPVNGVWSVAGQAAIPSDRWQLQGSRLLLTSRETAITVTYSHGYAVVPDDIRAVCLALATRILRAVNTTSTVTQETIGSYSVTYQRTDATPGLLDHERRILARYRRTATSLRIR